MNAVHFLFSSTSLTLKKKEAVRSCSSGLYDSDVTYDDVVYYCGDLFGPVIFYNNNMSSFWIAFRMSPRAKFFPLDTYSARVLGLDKRRVNQRGRENNPNLQQTQKHETSWHEARKYLSVYQGSGQQLMMQKSTITEMPVWPTRPSEKNLCEDHVVCATAGHEQFNILYLNQMS